MPSNNSAQLSESEWYIYIVRCHDNTYYTGITTDPERRVKEHNSADSGARYTRARQPVQLVYCETAPHRSAACSREYQIKQYSRSAKEILIGSCIGLSEAQLSKL